MTTEQLANTADILSSKIKEKTATIGVVGMGYVGLPLAAAVFEEGYSVIGFDLDPSKVEALQTGTPYLKHLGDDFSKAMADSDRFIATDSVNALVDADIIVLCVPTPLGKHNEPDLSYVLNSTRSIADILRKGHLIVLESTTYPGTTRDEMLPILEESGLKHGEDFFLAYSPEREDPGRKTETTQSIPKLVGGIDKISGELAFTFYNSVIQSVHLVSSAEVAESAKLLENIYRAVNIALVNEMKLILERLNIDVWEVIEAASTKPFGFQAFYPGPGLGGHCIPIDPFYLTWKAKEVGMPTRFIELAGEVNQKMPDLVVSRVESALNDDSKSLNGSSVLVVGVAYKPDVDDIRETPAALLIQLMQAKGANVSYHDPHVPNFPSMRAYDISLSSVELSQDSINSYDIILISTDHSCIDWDAIAMNAKIVVDTRNALSQCSEIRARYLKA
ncbi:MAG: UDP-N-acetyl-D-glucosamine dehydrogenase [Dehalococcoidia bacterium]|nr:UDP-N-acetyl-D-glucosamine dehydrogenase [Dehalococcoidia bacterium]